jgi:hypothetical protein
MHRVVIALSLQMLAFALAFLRYAGGVFTDEAKYLLNIPYPHPPLVRSVLAWLTAIPLHEEILRIVFATVLIQSVWIVRHAVRESPRRVRLAACALWLGSGAVLLQTGTLMMSPLTGVFGLVLVAVVMSRDQEIKEIKENKEWKQFALAMLWLASLFTAYQAVLYMPLLISALHRLGAGRRTIAMYVLGPLVPLIVYSLANPLSIGIMLMVAGAKATILHRIAGGVWLWWVAGSGILSILGIWGMVHGKRWDILATFALVFLYVTLSYQDYYAILLTPVLVAGAIVWLRDQPPVWNRVVWAPVIACTAVWLLGISSIGDPHRLWPTKNLARDVAMIASPSESDRLLIVGSFGHEWQYYWPGTILRYTPSLSEDSIKNASIVCLRECPVSFGTGSRLTMPVY